MGKKFKDPDEVDQWVDPPSKSARYSLMRTSTGWWGIWSNHDASITRLVSKDKWEAIAALEEINSDDDPCSWLTTSRIRDTIMTDEPNERKIYMQNNTTKLNQVAQLTDSDPS
jgi:hypothetical protein